MSALGARLRVRVVAGSALGLATGFGGMVFGSLAIFLRPIAQDFGWTRAAVSSAIIMSMLGLAIGAPIQGWLMERLGRRAVIGGAVVALGVMLGTLSFVSHSHVLFALCWLLLGALAAATGPNGYLSLLPPLFDRRLGLALSAAMVGIGVGAAGSAQLAGVLIQLHGWRFAYRVLAVAAVLGGGAALLVIGRPAAAGPPQVRARTGVVGPNFRQALGDGRLFQLALALAISSASGLGITVHTAAMLGDRGLAAGRIGMVVSFSGVGVMLGRLAGGVLMDGVPARLVGAGAYLMGAGAVVLLGFDPGRYVGLLAVGGLLLGMALGAEGDFAAFVVRRYFGTRAFSSLYGLVFSAYSLGSVAGVVLCGMAFDRWGNYRLASTACVAGFLVAAALVASLGPYRYGPATSLQAAAWRDKAHA